MRALSLFAFLTVGFAFVAGRTDIEGIIGGSYTTIQNHPYVAALLFTSDLASYRQSCVGTIINNRAILSAAHCFEDDAPLVWRTRVGSPYANSGGTVYITARIINHPYYNPFYYDNNLAIIHSASAFTFSTNVRAGSIAGINYIVADNDPLKVIGWGRNSVNETASEELREIKVDYININTCRLIYGIVAVSPSNDMLCSGWLYNVEPKQCQGNAGGPLLHNNVVVGVTAWGYQCSQIHYPGISTRISQYTPWIQANA